MTWDPRRWHPIGQVLLVLFLIGLAAILWEAGEVLRAIVQIRFRPPG